MSQIRQGVSIVIPAYNEERYLALCLESISRQTVAPVEVIVVDNNSTDTTAKIAQRYSFVRLISESQQGIVFARNTGFNATRGDIIARIDADTQLPADWVATVQAFYANPKNSHHIFTGCCYFYNLKSGKLAGKIYNVVVPRANFLMLGHYFPCGSNSALPRTAWEAIKNDTCNRTDIHEDLDLGVHLRQAGHKVMYHPRVQVGVVARRITHDHGKLWEYLSMWPRTYRLHRAQRWMLIWPIVAGLWVGSYGLRAFENLRSR